MKMNRRHSASSPGRRFARCTRPRASPPRSSPPEPFERIAAEISLSASRSLNSPSKNKSAFATRTSHGLLAAKAHRPDGVVVNPNIAGVGAVAESLVTDTLLDQRLDGLAV